MSKVTIKVNGKEHEFESNTTIQDVLEKLEVKGPMFVVERNLEVVQKDSYNEVVKEGDILEIVGFFGGG